MVNLLLSFERADKNHFVANVIVQDVAQKYQQGRLPFEKYGPGIIMATLAGISTVLGSLLVLFLPREGPSPSTFAFALGLAAGVMLAVSSEMLLPDDRVSDWWWVFILFVSGGAGCAALCKCGDMLANAGHTDPHRPVTPTDASPTQEEEQHKRQWRLTALLFMSLTLHNFPEGVAVAVSALSSHQLGITVCIAVALHNIPEGIALAVSTYNTTKSHMRSFMVTSCSALAEPLGAITAVLLFHAHATQPLIHSMLVVVAGIMCYIALFELVPEALATKCFWPAGAGVLSGIIVMVLTHHALETPEAEQYIESTSL